MSLLGWLKSPPYIHPNPENIPQFSTFLTILTIVFQSFTNFCSRLEGRIGSGFRVQGSKFTGLSFDQQYQGGDSDYCVFMFQEFMLEAGSWMLEARRIIEVLGSVVLRSSESSARDSNAIKLRKKAD